MQDKININGMVFYGYHGVYDEEKNLGQRFRVDVSLFLSLTEPGKSDELKDTVNYGEVYDLIKKVFTEEKFDLLEAVGYRITGVILNHFPDIERVRIKISKPSVPIEGVLEDVSIEIEEER